MSFAERGHVDLLLTIAQAIHSDITTFGDPAYAATPITELLVD